MQLTDEQQEELDVLINSGEKLEAIRYAQQTIGLDAESAISLVEKLEKQYEEEDEAAFATTVKEHEKSMSNVPAIIGGIFGGIGVLLLVLGAYFGYRTQTFLETAVAIPGIVKEYRESEAYNSEERRAYKVLAPVVEYHYNGTDYSWVSPYASSDPDFQIGDQIPLLVNPKDPSSPDIDSFFGKWFVAVLLGSMGLIFTGVGILVRRAFGKAQA